MDGQANLLGRLSKLRDSKTLILGIGNVLKGDDAAGPAVCRQLAEEKISAEIIDAGTVPENFIQPIVKKKPDNLLIIDAVDSGAETGSINIFEMEQLSSLAISTHTLSPRIFVDMIRGQIDVEVMFIGIQPGQRQFAQEMSKHVIQAVSELSKALAQVFPTGS